MRGNAPGVPGVVVCLFSSTASDVSHPGSSSTPRPSLPRVSMAASNGDATSTTRRGVEERLFEALWEWISLAHGSGEGCRIAGNAEPLAGFGVATVPGHAMGLVLGITSSRGVDARLGLAALHPPAHTGGAEGASETVAHSPEPSSSPPQGDCSSIAGIPGEPEEESKARGGRAMSDLTGDASFWPFSESVTAHGEPHGSSILQRDDCHVAGKTRCLQFGIVSESASRDQERALDIDST